MTKYAVVITGYKLDIDNYDRVHELHDAISEFFTPSTNRDDQSISAENPKLVLFDRYHNADYPMNCSLFIAYKIYVLPMGEPADMSIFKQITALEKPYIPEKIRLVIAAIELQQPMDNFSIHIELLKSRHTFDVFS